MKTISILEEQYIAMSLKCAKYDALKERVEKLNQELDDEGNDEGLDLFGEMLLNEFGWM